MYKNRILRLQLFLEHPILIKKKENLLYLTGRSFMNGYLLIKPRKNPDSYAEKHGRPSVVFLGDGLENSLAGGVKIHSDILKNVGMYILPKETLQVFGEFTYAEVKYIKFKNKDLKLKIIVKHSPVDFLRAVKDREEIRLIGNSMRIVEKVFYLVRKKLSSARPLQPAWTELTLAKFIQNQGLKFGAEALAFPAIVASGSNAAVPHHVPTSKKLKKGEPIIIDFGFKYKNYCSDFTRTIFLKKVHPKLEVAYKQVEKAYWGAIKSCEVGNGLKPFPTGEIIYQNAVRILVEKKLDKYFIHSLGHGTGLEIHELPNLSPNSKDILRQGMVFSIEPGVYLPKIGGIRIEDLVYLYSEGIKKFISVPTSLEENIIH